MPSQEEINKARLIERYLDLETRAQSYQRLGERAPITITAPSHDATVFERMTWHAESLLGLLDGWNDIPEDHRAKTPERLVKSLIELTVREPFDFTTFENPAKEKSEMIVLEPIPFYTMCAHHIVPFFGHAYIGYVPEDRIAGLSKFARLVQWCAKGFWVQEELTNFLAEELYSRLEPKGTAVVMRAEHMCMAMRGAKVPGVVTTTSDMRGCYADHTKLARQEFFALAGIR